MGDMADAIINGDFDYISGEWLGEGDGFPRSLHDYQPNPMFGVLNWLTKRGITNNQAQMDAIRGFFTTPTDNKSKKELCISISKDFNKFKTYIYQLNKPVMTAEIKNWKEVKEQFGLQQSKHSFGAIKISKCLTEAVNKSLTDFKQIPEQVTIDYSDIHEGFAMFERIDSLTTDKSVTYEYTGTAN